MNLILFASLCCLLSVSSSESDSFTEELLLKPLYTNKLYAHFQFTTKWDVDDRPDALLHTHLFPRALSEVLIRHNVLELHISLTSGLWRYETWGYPIIDASPGAEVLAWFKSDTVDVNKNWLELTNSLSGLLCASLNFVDETNSISPEISLRHKAAVKNALNSTFVRYSTLPREIVCTENLTPWKKLLPCGNKAGLATLLNSGYIHSTHYHSIGIHVRPICRNGDCTQATLELQQTVSMVYDYTILGTRNWSLRRLFGQGILTVCPLAETSTIYVDVSSNASTPFDLSPEPDEYIVSNRGGFTSKFAKYDLAKAKPMSIAASHTTKEVFNVIIPPPLYVSQYKTGIGQQNGGLVTQIYNNHWAKLDVTVLQNFPWYVPIYLHTMKIQSNGEELSRRIRYQPGKVREKHHYLEIALTLPPKSITKISIDFDYVFLKWQEYPPDANHGFYIGSGIISALLPLSRNYTGIPLEGSFIRDSFNSSDPGYLVQVRTETIIITLPTPDFSMPYNVICLACTVVALAFGPLHNITTKRLVLRVQENRNILQKLKDKIVGVFKR